MMRIHLALAHALKAGPNREHPLLFLQRTIGNRLVSRLVVSDLLRPAAPVDPTPARVNRRVTPSRALASMGSGIAVAFLVRWAFPAAPWMVAPAFGLLFALSTSVLAPQVQGQARPQSAPPFGAGNT